MVFFYCTKVPIRRKMLFNKGKFLFGERPLIILSFSALLLIFSYIAGLLGALTGLGGGIIVIPVLVLLFHIDIHYAMGASIISVIATSSGTAAAYMREGYTNLRIGVFLETAAVIGAFLGALAIAKISVHLLSIIFSLVLFLSAYFTLKRKEDKEQYASADRLATHLQLNGTYPLNGSLNPYQVQRVPLAFMLMGIAGFISGLLGIGSGTLKVLAMDQTMRLPYKVATTTSNFMIGITAAVSAGIYFSHGFIQPAITFPVMLGVIAGAFSGAKMLPRIHHESLRIIFSIAICIVGVQMLYQTLKGMF